jgi:hypothetical protein
MCRQTGVDLDENVLDPTYPAGYLIRGFGSIAGKKPSIS